MDFWDVCTLLGVLLSAFSGICAFISAKLGLMTWRQMQLEEELSRACVGESNWFIDGNRTFGRLKIWPGRHFVQTKTIRLPGHKLAYVAHSSIDGRDVRYVRGDWVDVLIAGVSVPVSGGAVELEFAVSGVPVSPFTVIIDLARGEPPIEYRVVMDISKNESPSRSRDL